MKKFSNIKEFKIIKRFKVITIGISCLLLIGIIFNTFIKIDNKNESFELRFANEDSNIIAVYKDDVKVNDIPGKNSGYYFDKAECDNGVTTTWDNEEWGLNIRNISKKPKCILYFKKKYMLSGNGSSMILALKSYNTSTEEIIVDGKKSSLAYDRTTDNNLRYIGKNPDNYVDIGEKYQTDLYYGYYSDISNSYKAYSSKNDCISASNYNTNCTKIHSAGETALWRIIGIFNNIYTTSSKTNPQTLIKIIRAESLGEYSWDSSASGINGGYGINQWGASGTYEGADLMNELNKDYLGTSWAGSTWYNGNNNNKDALKPASTLNSTVQNMIQQVIWNLGSPSNNNGSYDSNWESNITPSLSYTRERTNTNGKICSSPGSFNSCNDSVTRTSTWYGKVALMYPSDYGYATAGGSTTNRSECLQTAMSEDSWNKRSHSDCKNNNWLFDSTELYTLSPFANTYGANKVFRIDDNGYIELNGNLTSTSGSWDTRDYVRPSFYLKSNVEITGGTGTSTDPYTLG